MNHIFKNLAQINHSRPHRRPGVVLLTVLVLLVILATVGYTLSTRVSTVRHRNRYMIDHQMAYYACGSAVKYSLAVLNDIKPELISRPNEPDFSDLFILPEPAYQKLLEQVASQSISYTSADFNNTNEPDDVNGVYETNDVNASDNSLLAASPQICGPYGPPWPLVAEPIEFMIGQTKIRIEIEDENAKFPLGWAILTDMKVKKEASASFKTFCEWMDVNSTEADSIKQDIKQISEIKTFNVDFGPIKRSIIKRYSRRSVRGSSKSYRSSEVIIKAPITVHPADFAQFFHSSLVNTQILARPTIESQTREESALKYLAVFGSSKVNINTAPRNVLEAAFTFGGDAVEIADEIIKRRQIKPFADIEELEKTLFAYSDSIKKCQKYILSDSRFFTIRINAVKGAAQASAIIAVMKDEGKMQPIVIILS